MTENILGYKFQAIFTSLVCGIISLAFNEIGIALRREAMPFAAEVFSGVSVGILIIPLILVICLVWQGDIEKQVVA